MAKTKFKTEYIEQAYKLCLLGATDVQLAECFEVSVSTINTWKKRFEGFADALKRGKKFADADVAESLYRRACGSEKALPDTTACIFWLKNRQSQNWRDKREVKDDSGLDIRDAYLKALKKGINCAD